MTRTAQRPPRPGPAREPRAGGVRTAAAPPCRRDPDTWDLDTYLLGPYDDAAATIRAAAAGCAACARDVPAAAAACAASPPAMHVPRTVMFGKVISAARGHTPTDPERYIKYGLWSARRGALARAAADAAAP